MTKKNREKKKNIDVLWDRFCKRELTLDELIEEVNKFQSIDKL
ncbi:MAG: hypothetical protein ACQESP_01985 [Candidatus Muiribacteriota bacterium]